MVLLALGAKAQALVKDINIGLGNSDPTGFCRLNNHVFFIANDGIHGNELWITDGSDTGTAMVKDINPGLPDGCLYYGARGTRYPQLQALGNYVYFFANDGLHGFELWRSDGTEAGTAMVKDILPGQASSSTDLALVRLDSFLIFCANDGVHGPELWRSNGVDTGTFMVKDFYPGPDGSNPQCFFVDSSVVYFAANNGTDGYGISKSNGTAEGTVYIKNVSPQPTRNDSVPYIKYQGAIYFNGFDLDHGAELWKTDGTTGGTELVRDINAGMLTADPSLFVIYKDKLVFSANDGPEGFELWASDGTPAGTHIVKDICPGHRGSHPSGLAVIDTNLFFVASDGNGKNQFWISDLTDTGTRIFQDTLSKIYFSQPKVLYKNKQLIYLSCTKPGGGTELWVTNGSLEGTHLLNEICGGCSTEPSAFYAADTVLLFSAMDKVHGRELFQIGKPVNLITAVTDLERRDVYPDPLRKELYQMSRTGTNIVYLKVFNLGGDELLRQDAQKPIPVEVASFAPGIYILRAYDKDDRQVAFTRFVKP